MARRTASHNEWKKFSAAVAERLGYAGEHLSNWAKMWMDEAVGKAIAQLDADWPQHTETSSGARFGGDHNHPWYYGQLHDSVAGFVSDKNKTVGSIHYMPTAATKPQTYKGVPYAREVDETGRHAGYIQELSAQFANEIEDYFASRAGEYRTRVFIADKKKK